MHTTLRYLTILRYSTILVLALLFYSTNAIAQNGWLRLGQDEFNGIDYISANRIVAVANEGRILVSTDSGNTWERQQIDTYTDLVGVSFHGAAHGIVIGWNSGEVFYTSDSGTTWSPASKTVPDLANYVAFVSDDTAFIAGSPGHFFRSIDGGNTWDSVNIGSNARINALKFLSSQLGYAVGESGVILRTRDGGSTWQTLPSGTTWTLTAVDFLDDSEGVAAGYDPGTYPFTGVVLRTTDGGKTWQMHIISSDTLDFNPHGIWMIDTNHILINGDQEFFRTADGGISWTPEGVADAFGQGATYIALSSLDSGKAVVAGQYGLIMSTENAGKDWNIRSLSNLGEGIVNLVLGEADCVQFIDGRTAYAAGGSDIWRSDDSGITWKWLSAHEYLNNLQVVFDLHFTDANHGMTIEERYGEIYRTTDGGQSWALDTSIGEGPVRLFFPNPNDSNNQYTVGDSIIYHTLDGWATYSSYSPPSFHLAAGQLYLRKIVFNKSGQIGFVTGEIIGPFGSGGKDTEHFGRSYRTSDGGVTWNSIFTNEPQGIECFYFKDSNTVFAAGDKDVLYRSTDQGVNWTEQHSGGGKWTAYQDINFMNDSVGFVVGGDTSILVTTDGGNTWAKEDPWPHDDLRQADESFSRVVFPSPNTVFLCGSHTFFRKHYSFAQSSVRNTTRTDDYMFTGKYLYITSTPNPATNMVTIILAGLNSMGGVPANLTIYDLLGRKIADLTSNLRAVAGDDARLNWDVSQIASGIYTVRFSGGSFSRSTEVIVLH